MATGRDERAGAPHVWASDWEGKPPPSPMGDPKATSSGERLRGTIPRHPKVGHKASCLWLPSQQARGTGTSDQEDAADVPEEAYGFATET